MICSSERQIKNDPKLVTTSKKRKKTHRKYPNCSMWYITHTVKIVILMTWKTVEKEERRSCKAKGENQNTDAYIFIALSVRIKSDSSYGR